MPVLCVNSGESYPTMDAALSAELPSSFTGQDVVFEVDGIVTETNTGFLDIPSGEQADRVVFTAKAGQEFNYQNGATCAAVDSATSGNLRNQSGKPLLIEKIKLVIQSIRNTSANSPIEISAAYCRTDENIANGLLYGQNPDCTATNTVLVAPGEVVNNCDLTRDNIIIRNSAAGDNAVTSANTDVFNNAICHDQAATGQIGFKLVNPGLNSQCDYCATNDDSGNTSGVGTNGGIGLSDPGTWFEAGSASLALSTEDFRLKSDSILFGNGDGVSGSNIGPDAAYAGSPTVVDVFTGVAKITDKITAQRSLVDTFSGVGLITDKPESARTVTDVFAGVGAITDSTNKQVSIADVIGGRGVTLDATNGTRFLIDQFAGVGKILDSGILRVGDDVTIADDFIGVGRITDVVTTRSFSADVYSGVGAITDSYQKQVSMTDVYTGVGTITDIAIQGGQEPTAPILESTGRYNQVIGSVGIWDPDI